MDARFVPRFVNADLVSSKLGISIPVRPSNLDARFVPRFVNAALVSSKLGNVNPVNSLSLELTRLKAPFGSVVNMVNPALTQSTAAVAESFRLSTAAVDFAVRSLLHWASGDTKSVNAFLAALNPDAADVDIEVRPLDIVS